MRVSSVKLNEISKFWALNNAPIVFGDRAPPDPLWHSTRPDPLAVMGQGREGHGEEGEGKGRETGKGEGKGKGRTGDGKGNKGEGK